MIFLRLLATVVVFVGLLEAFWAFNALMNTPDDFAVTAAALMAVAVPGAAFWLLKALWRKAFIKLRNGEIQ